jgi:small acid-soluble spore protein F (minor alpha/beta-type SASP)
LAVFFFPGPKKIRRGGEVMARRRSIVSDEVKYEIARELGFADRIRRDGGGYDYGNITTREAGLIVRGLIQKAEEMMKNNQPPQGRF